MSNEKASKCFFWIKESNQEPAKPCPNPSVPGRAACQSCIDWMEEQDRRIKEEMTNTLNKEYNLASGGGTTLD